MLLLLLLDEKSAVDFADASDVNVPGGGVVVDDGVAAVAVARVTPNGDVDANGDVLGISADTDIWGISPTIPPPMGDDNSDASVGGLLLLPFADTVDVGDVGKEVDGKRKPGPDSMIDGNAVAAVVVVVAIPVDGAAAAAAVAAVVRTVLSNLL